MSDAGSGQGTVAALPPVARSAIAQGLTDAALRGEFALQVCPQCAATQYPPREACHRCLADGLAWQAQDGRGELLCATVLHHSHEPYFRARLPWRIGLVQLAAGPTLLTHLDPAVREAPCAVTVTACIDPAGRAALVALPCAVAQGPEAVRRAARLFGSAP
ncbi:MAG TPA: OB-fold domain-containing protein [Steroidobacteraceae bacterium]|nr:OB-fold domain-containing protein [Steroidobacteraceae bacterium]